MLPARRHLFSVGALTPITSAARLISEGNSVRQIAETINVYAATVY